MSSSDASDADKEVELADSDRDSVSSVDAAEDTSPVVDGAWTQSPLYATCPWWIGDVSTVSLAARVWAVCGDGCRDTTAARPGITFADGVAVAAESVAGGFLARITSGNGAGGEAVTEFTELVTGRLIAILKRTKTAGLCQIGGRSPRLAVGIESDKLVHARLFEATGAFQWQAAPLTLPSASHSVAAWNTGTAFFLDDGSTRTITSPTQKSLSVAYTDSLPVFDPASGAQQVVWATDDLKGRLLRVSDAGVATLVTADRRIPGVGQSDKWIVWSAAIEGDGGKGWASIELRWTPWAADAAGVSIVNGPAVPVTSLLNAFAVGSDYAASIGCADTPPCPIFVVNLTTRKLWRIPPRAPDRVWRRIYAISDSEMLLGEAFTTTASSLVDRFVLLRLDKLDLFAK